MEFKKEEARMIEQKNQLRIQILKSVAVWSVKTQKNLGEADFKTMHITEIDKKGAVGSIWLYLKRGNPAIFSVLGRHGRGGASEEIANLNSLNSKELLRIANRLPKSFKEYKQKIKSLTANLNESRQKMINLINQL